MKHSVHSDISIHYLCIDRYKGEQPLLLCDKRDQFPSQVIELLSLIRQNKLIVMKIECVYRDCRDPTKDGMREKLSIVVDYESVTQVTKLGERERGERERERREREGGGREGGREERERERKEGKGKGERKGGKLTANVSVLRSKIIIIITLNCISV